MLLLALKLASSNKISHFWLNLTEPRQLKMLVSNRLLRAAMSALANQLAADADAAIKRYESSTVYTDYAREACTVRAVLEQMGEDVSISSAKVLLPGEKA